MVWKMKLQRVLTRLRDKLRVYTDVRNTPRDRLISSSLKENEIPEVDPFDYG